MFLTGAIKTAAEAHRDLIKEGYELSYRTVCRTLNSMGFCAKIKQKKPLLSKKHIVARYKWAKAHEPWTPSDPQMLIFVSSE